MEGPAVGEAVEDVFAVGDDFDGGVSDESASFAVSPSEFGFLGGVACEDVVEALAGACDGVTFWHGVFLVHWG